VQAEAEAIDHFLIITNSYLSRDTKAWIEKIRPGLKFKVHVLDGKNLNKKLLVFPELIAEYFADDTTRLVRDLYKQWLFHDSLPHIKTLYKISKAADPDRLSLTEMVFLIFVLGKLDHHFYQNDIDEELGEFDFDLLLPFIVAKANKPFPVLNKTEQENHHVKYYLEHSSSHHSNWTGKGIDSQFFHNLIPYGQGGLLEMFFERDINKRMDVRVGLYVKPKKES